MRVIRNGGKGDSRRNIIDFSKRARDLSHIPKPPNEKKGFKGVKIPKIITFIILLFIVSISAFTFLNSQIATIQKLNIEGNFLLDKQEILDNLPKVGQANFYRLSNDKLESMVLENQWVKSVDITKHYFSRIIDVNIEERRPIYRTISGSETRIVDEEGMVLPNLSTILGLSVPFVVGTQDQRILSHLVETLRVLPDHFIYLISEVNLERTNSVYLITVDKFIIQIGELGNLTPQRTDEILQVIRSQKESNKRGIIDIRGRNITFTPVEG